MHPLHGVLILQEYWSIGVFGSPGPHGVWSIGLGWLHGSIGVWSIGVLEYWSIGVWSIEHFRRLRRADVWRLAARITFCLGEAREKKRLFCSIRWSIW